MNIPQSYETIVFDEGRTYGFHMFVVPWRSVPPTFSNKSIELLSKDIKLTDPIDISPAYLPHALTALVPEGDPLPNVESFNELRVAFGAAGRRPEFKFAQQVAFARIVPFESSPLTAEALASILVSGVAGAGAVGIGAKLGIVAFGATTGPALLLAAAGGIVVVTLASSAGTEIGKGIAAKVQEWMGIARQ
ncbi:hypothetical protein [Bradyrhizobium sp. USDA 3458]|uniref:hypothetical protein n=1 Tax=Bradyrhizobium sp. USDA 3458 TaxID=2591461 RepID=UPI0011432465|nr:hypothetical protein [Bradyrhizobium sp. USDA 3458]